MIINELRLTNFCIYRGEKSYEDLLRSSINHQVDPQMEASIGLTFRYASEGSENVYEVQRMWAAGSGGAIRERVLILKDGNRAYHLNYDEAGRMTNVEEGYFWKATDSKVSG